MSKTPSRKLNSHRRTKTEPRRASEPPSNSAPATNRVPHISPDTEDFTRALELEDHAVRELKAYLQDHKPLHLKKAALLMKRVSKILEQRA